MALSWRATEEATTESPEARQRRPSGSPLWGDVKPSDFSTGKAKKKVKEKRRRLKLLRRRRKEQPTKNKNVIHFVCDGKQQTKTKTQTATVLRAMNIREVENNATVIPDCAFRQAKKKEKKKRKKGYTICVSGSNLSLALWVTKSCKYLYRFHNTLFLHFSFSLSLFLSDMLTCFR